MALDYDIETMAATESSDKEKTYELTALASSTTKIKVVPPSPLLEQNDSTDGTFEYSELIGVMATMRALTSRWEFDDEEHLLHAYFDSFETEDEVSTALTRLALLEHAARVSLAEAKRHWAP